jgi:hypothetical protein
MAVVAGVDFGTLSVRVSIVDSERGRIGSGVAEYPLHRRADDPDYATQSHADHMRALAEATRKAVATAGVDGASVVAIAIDTTGSSVVPVDAQLQPLDDYYLWCDHRAWREAAEITRAAHAAGLPAFSGAVAPIHPSGDFPSFCTGCARIRTNELGLRARWSIAIWLPRPCAGSRILPAYRDRSAQWAQMDVERIAGRPAFRGVPDQCGPSAIGRSREVERSL